MADIWIVSDHHFCQESSLRWTRDDGTFVRPFSSVDEMDEVMIERHNSVVKKGDKVWFGGDVCGGKNRRKFFTDILPRLNGHLRMVAGNHDEIAEFILCKRFNKVQESRHFGDHGLILTHRPIHESGLMNHYTGEMMRNIHGHIHDNMSPTEYHFNICVEKNNYTPFNIDELRIK